MRIVIAIVVTAAVCVGAAFLLMGSRGEKKPENETAPVEQHVPRAPILVYDVGEFLVNVNSADQLRYLRVQLALRLRGYGEVEEKKAGGHGGHGGKPDDGEGELPKLKAPDEAMARDVIVRTLSDHSYEELRADGGHGKVKEELRAELDDVFDEQVDVVDVLFLAFVMQ